jgi:hypothetical protein
MTASPNTGTAADRARRYRLRQKLGVIRVIVEIDEATIDALVAAGLTRSRNSEAVAQAVLALARGVLPPRGAMGQGAFAAPSRPIPPRSWGNDRGDEAS